MTDPTYGEHETQENTQAETLSSPFELEGNDPSSAEAAARALQEHQEEASADSGAVFGLEGEDETYGTFVPPELAEGDVLESSLDTDEEASDESESADISDAPLILDLEEAKKIIETLLYVAHEPLRPRDISMVFRGVENVDVRAVRKIIAELMEEYADRTIQIVEVADGYRMCTRLEFSPWVRRLLKQERRWRVSNAGLETLAIIAYKQPITKTEVEEIRRVDCGGVIHTLLERKLVRVLGRRDVIGRPIVYGTTPQFLQHFGFKNLSDMPKPEEFDMEMDLGGELPGGDIILLESEEGGQVPLLDEEQTIPAHTNGHTNGHANGSANGHSNGHANGHANGHSVPAEEEEAELETVVADQDEGQEKAGEEKEE